MAFANINASSNKVYHNDLFNNQIYLEPNLEIEEIEAAFDIDEITISNRTSLDTFICRMEEDSSKDKHARDYQNNYEGALKSVSMYRENIAKHTGCIIFVNESNVGVDQKETI